MSYCMCFIGVIMWIYNAYIWARVYLTVVLHFMHSTVIPVLITWCTFYTVCALYLSYLIGWYIIILSTIKYFPSLVFLLNLLMPSSNWIHKRCSWGVKFNPEIHNDQWWFSQLGLYIFWGCGWSKFQFLVYLSQHIQPASPPHYARFFTSLLIRTCGVNLIYLIPFKLSSLVSWPLI